MKVRVCFVIAALSLIAGCASDSGGSGKSDLDPNGEVSAQGTLEKADPDSFLRYLQVALVGGANSGVEANAVTEDAVVASSDAPASSESASASAAGGSRLSSSTNLQEAGVDEADLIKLDATRSLVYSIDYGMTDKYPYPESIPVDTVEESSPDVSGSVTGGGESTTSTPGDGDKMISPGAEDITTSIAYYPAPPQQTESIRVMALSSDSSSIAEVARITRDDKDLHLHGLYLAPGERRLISVGSGAGNVYSDWFTPYAFMQQSTQIDLIDVSQPEAPAPETQYRFDGSLVASRMIGPYLYLVLRQYPQIDHWVVYPATLEDKQENEKTVEALSSDELLPQYSVNNGAKQALVDPGACYLNRGVSRPTADLVTLVAVDTSKTVPTIESTCYVGPTEALYASQNALYLASTRYNYEWSDTRLAYPAEMTTDIHKFAFDGAGFDYRGSAEVIGHLGWHQDRKSFRLSESAAGDLRVLTYVEPAVGILPLPVEEGIAVQDSETAEAVPAGNGFSASAQPRAVSADIESPVYLTILGDAGSGQDLETLSRLPNASQPSPIGKPGEDLYATRYVGDRAYLITFRVTDPLYVLDLADPRNPAILGELELPGFSDYLHPITETLLLGVGKDAVPDATGWGDGRGAWYQGVKLSLLDVSDPASPQEVDQIVIGKRGTESAVLTDHHAFTGLRIGDQYRVALPVTLNEKPDPYASGKPWDYYNYTHTGLYRYNINLSSKQIETLSPMVVERAGNSDGYWWGGFRDADDRSVIVDDYVHYLHEGQFWSSPWEADSILTGPQ